MAQAMSLDKLREQIHKCPEGMIDSAPPGSQPKAFLLADRICRWCEENKHASPYGTVFTPDHFSIQVATAWQTDTAHRYFEANIRPPAVVEDAQAHGKGDDSVWGQPGTLAFQDASASLLCIEVHRVAAHRWRDAALPNPRLAAARGQRHWRQGRGREHGHLARRGGHTAGRRRGRDRREVVAHEDRVPRHRQATAETEPLGQPGDDDWCVYRASVLPDASVDFPHIRSFLDRLNDPRAFAAWWWGVYSGVNKGRQSIYLWDARGEGAKSVILKTLGSLFGNRIYASFPTSVSLADGFTSSAFVNKKLVVIGDCKDSYILHRGMLKELSPAMTSAGSTPSINNHIARTWSAASSSPATMRRSSSARRTIPRARCS